MPADDNNPKHPPRGPDVTLPDDPTVRARRKLNRPDDGEAFLPDPTTYGRSTQTDAEFFGEEFVASATTGEPLHMEALDEVTEEEEGGPFLELDANADAEAEDVSDAQGEEIEPPRPRNPRRSLPR